jgi:hypothetical protein
VLDWDRYLGNTTMATTILNLFMQRCDMLDFKGRGYRFEEASTRIAICPGTS